MLIWERFVDYEKIKFTPLPKKRGQRTKITYTREFAAFDIETTRLADIEQSFMYVWQFAIGLNLVIMGRTWDEFRHMINSLKDRLGGMRLMIYVHNLNFEGTFISSPQVYKFENSEVFSTDSHAILRMMMYDGSFELRCAWRLTQLGLEAFTRRYDCMYTKRSGEEFDYDKIRTPSTPLTRKELLYCAYDVLGLVEAVTKQMEMDGDTLYSIPYTQTGYVRREAKKLMRPYKWNVQDCFPSKELYHVLRNAFRGGNTHSNRYYVNEVIKDVHGIDISSSYPAQQVLEYYPVHPFKRVGTFDLTTKHLETLIDQEYCVVFHARFYNLRLRYEYEPIPYISRAKCISNIDKRHYCVDNGRVLRAYGLWLELTMTEIDYKIVCAQYVWDRMEIISMFRARSGRMYEGLRQLNIKLFTEKTKLKGIPEKKIYYDKAKEMLNGIYGMSCQNPLSPEILFSDPEDDEYKMSFVKSGAKDEDTLLAEAKHRAFITYQLGVYTTAHARAELQRVIDLHKDYVIYCDTDSVMYKGEIAGLDAVNEEYKRRDIESGGCAQDSFGNMHYMGVFENEDDPRHGVKYAEFKCQGAKKYAYRKWDKEDKLRIGITVAGVPKKKGAIELEKAGGLAAFKDGFVFSDSGKLGVIYNEDYGEVEVNGEKINITRNANLTPVTYTLGWTKDYENLLSYVTDEKLEYIVQDAEF